MKKILSLVLLTCFCSMPLAKASEGINKNQYKILKCNEKTGVCIARKTPFEYVLVTKENKLLTQIEYQNLEAINSNLYLVTTKEHKNGLIDNQGQIILEPKYQIRPSRIENTLQYSLVVIKNANNTNNDNIFFIIPLKYNR